MRLVTVDVVVRRVAVGVLALALAGGATFATVRPAAADAGQGDATSPVSLSTPAVAAPVSGAVTRRFDPPDGPYGRGHRGVDLDVAAGDPVQAAADGTVAFAGPVAGVGWITLRHARGLETTYGGVEPTVAVGDAVAMGEVIGRMARDSHLDWGARLDDRYIDPLGLLVGWRVALVPVSD